MIKNAVIAILIACLTQQLLLPDLKSMVVLDTLLRAFTIFVVVTGLEEMWDAHRKQVLARIRWRLIRIREWPMELTGRRRRRKRLKAQLEELKRLQLLEEIGWEGGDS